MATFTNTIPKTIWAKVYTKEGVYIGVVNNILNEPSVTQTKNEVTNEVSIEIATDILTLDERGIVEFNKIWYLYYANDNNQDGELYFTGFVNSYDIDYLKNQVVVGLRSYDTELDNYLVKTSETQFDSDTVSNNEIIMTASGVRHIWFPITTGAGTISISSILIIASVSGGKEPIGNLTAKIYESQAQAEARGNDYIATASVQVTNPVVADKTFSFANPLVNSNTTYYVLITHSGDTISIKVDSTGTSTRSYITSWSGGNDSIYFYAYGPSTTTTVSFVATAIEDIVVSALDSFIEQGGRLNYKINNDGIFDSQTTKDGLGIIVNSAVTSALAFSFSTTNGVENITDLVIGLSHSGAGTRAMDVTVKIYETQADAEAFAATHLSTTSASFTGITTTSTDYTISLNETQVEPQFDYWCLIQITSTPDGNILIAGDTTLTGTRMYNGSWADSNASQSPANDQYMIYFKMYGESNAPYSISATGVTATYTFNTNTILEVINKCAELAGDDWYWYVNPTTNTFYFKQLDGNTINHRFQIGKEVNKLSVIKRQNNIISDVYFTGGDTGGGSFLYEQYSNNQTVSEYRYKATRITDGRVTTSATASRLSQTALSKGAVPELIAQCSVIDSSASNMGYDIHSLAPGQYVQITNTNATGSSLYDFAFYDKDYYDFDLARLHSVPLQIVTIRMYITRAELVLGAVADSFISIVEKGNREAKLNLVLNNTASPS